MKTFLLLGFLTNAAFAGCNIYVSGKTFYHESGAAIYFDLTKPFSEKGYIEVPTPQDSHHIVTIEGFEREGRFNKAEAHIQMGPLSISKSVTCLTQLCAISDYAKAFNKTYEVFVRKLPACL